MTPNWIHPTHSSSREAPDIRRLPGWRVDRAALEELPWVRALYEGPALECAQQFRAGVQPSKRPYGLGINASRGNRGEIHVDCNCVQGLLHLVGTGSLVVAHNPDAIGIAQVHQAYTALPFIPGMFYAFDATDFPHYACPGNGLRANVECNYYAPPGSGRGTEGMRPPTLTGHLIGSPRD